MITVLILVEFFYILISSLAELCCCVIDFLFLFFGGKNICLMRCSVSLINSCIQYKSYLCFVNTYLYILFHHRKTWSIGAECIHSYCGWVNVLYLYIKCIQVRHFISLFIPCFLWTELAYAGTSHHVNGHVMCDLVIRMWSLILR